MKQGRTPDRVHVVREPQDDYRAPSPSNGLPVAPQNSRAMEIIRTLAAISDKLKRSEAERYELLAELREYRKSLNELEDKAERSEKAYQTLEQKIKSRETTENESTQRQARFERALKEAESKLVQASAGQNLLITRIKDTEDKHAALTHRIDESVVQQARLDRQMEKIGQDKTRMLRKVERMEEILTETQDTLKARALVLLTDQSVAAQSNFPQIAAYGEDARGDMGEGAPWWRRSVQMQGVGMAALIVAALLSGWAINQMQQPEIPKIAILENGGLARLNLEQNQWEAVNADTSMMEPPKASETEATLTPVQSAGETPSASEQTPEAEAVLNASDEQLMAALEADPDKLATQLNDIAPESVQQELNAVEETPATRVVKGAYDPLANLQAKAFVQDPQVANIVAKDKGTKTLSERIAKDETLPASIKSLEEQAFAGIPEAQHDLAAIYTAGRGGVTQNFEKAALWFREAADNKIANASYNLGVLYHQGLGVERDLDRALFWYREAAKLGHPEAQYNLGIAHIEGIGTQYDAPLAAAFFESSANQGITEAAYNLGLIYENGLIAGGAKTEDALLWYKIAADGGSTDAKAALAQLASHLQIGNEDIDKMVERMQSIYSSTKGRRAGPDKNVATAQAPSISSNKAIVAQIQELLRQQGIYQGQADGMTGPQTVEAIRTYQAQNNMKVTGLATQDLLAKMLQAE
jgi:TPR repeat protein